MPVKIAEVEFITVERNILSLEILLWITINNIFIKIGSVYKYINFIVRLLRSLNIALPLKYSIIRVCVYIS